MSAPYCAIGTDNWGPLCPACRGDGPAHHHEGKHEPDCLLDAALTAAGLDTQEKRDAARANR